MQNEKIVIRHGEYRAEIFPEAGGALVTLDKGDVHVFWPCESGDEAAAAPTRHGLPCLFPPNRIDAGHFWFDGREYQFPMKPNKANNFSHGFLHIRPWKAVDVTENSVTMRYDCDESTDFYPYYPHKFRFDVRYTLSDEGLCQEAEVTNYGELPMPIGLGWHTAFALSGGETKVRMSVGKRILFSDRMLPTGDVRDLSEAEKLFRADAGQSPVYAPMDDHFTVEKIQYNGRDFHGAILEDTGVRIIYEVDDAYKHWMVFNAKAAGNIICIEPQNWRINAPNLDMPYEESGLDVLKKGESKCYVSRIKVE